MNPLFEAGLEIQLFIQSKGWSFCFIGGLTVIRWGEPRMTQDIDLSLFTGFGGELVFIDELLEHFSTRIESAKEFALKNRVLLITASNGVSVDLALAGLPFEEKMMQRASSFAFDDNCLLTTCSAEDLVILKAFAARAQDWLDVEGIIVRQGEKLDRDYILQQLTPLCQVKESPEIISHLEKMFAKGA